MTVAEKSTAPPSAWSPLRIGVFRALWLAVLVSNIGTWMQTVGAQWLLIHLPHAAVLVALVQVADNLPDVLFGLVGGVLADIFDRRRLLIVTQLGLAAVGALLTVLTYRGEMPPHLLIGFTFVIGFSSVLSNPAYQAIVPELVPRAELRAASTLGAMSVNIARLIGPGLAGLVIARMGVSAVFALNTLSYVFFAIVVALWRPPQPAAGTRLPERFGSAVRAGVGYVRHSPVVARIFLRATLFLVPASVLWALLPLIASETLHLDAGGYGIMLGALGAGALGGAFILPRVREVATDNVMLAAASAVYAAALALLVVAPGIVVAVLVLLPAGAAWMAVLSHINAELQLFLPAWVRARGMSVYQMVLFGGQAAGALLWGVMAEPFGVGATFLVAAVLLAGTAVSIKWWPLIDTSKLDTGPADHWPPPKLVFDAKEEDGPVVVNSVYTVPAEREAEFLVAMEHVRESRLRTGATQWTLFREGEHAARFVEIYVVPTWGEHLRQHHHRQTIVDRDIDRAAQKIAGGAPVTVHLFAAD